MTGQKTEKERYFPRWGDGRTLIDDIKLATVVVLVSLFFLIGVPPVLCCKVGVIRAVHCEVGQHPGGRVIFLLLQCRFSMGTYARQLGEILPGKWVG